MPTRNLFLFLALLASPFATLAQEPKPTPSAAPEAEAAGPRTPVDGWGTAINPAEDCAFKTQGSKLQIVVPGSKKPHDLGAEISSMTAPRVLQPITGDFRLEVRVDGEFQPGDVSTEQARTGYSGAGLVVFADLKNYVRIERATLHSGGDVEHPYTNFEIRVNGAIERFGTTGDLPTEDGKPTWLRLERVGDQMLGSMSQDGVHWNYGNPKTLSPEIWNKEPLQVGVAAISTSTMAFSPVYSEFSVKKLPKEEPEKPENKAEAK